jgi:hypothetical protein
MMGTLDQAYIEEGKSMKSILRISAISLFAFLTGCVQSLQPIYTEQDLVADDSFIGSWDDKESNETWAFSKTGRLEYKLLHTDAEGSTGEFIVRLVKVESSLFLDIVPTKPTPANTHLYQGRPVQTHTFAHIVRKSGAIEVSVLEMNWLKDLVAENAAAISHEKINGDIVLTSSPKETQKFILEHLATRGAFSEPARLTRRKRQ